MLSSTIPLARSLARVAALLTLALPACTGTVLESDNFSPPVLGMGGQAGSGIAPTPVEEPVVPVPPPPFEGLPATAYVAKVKDILTGLPPTAEDIVAVKEDPKALRRLVQEWTKVPAFRERMLGFFTTAFQQRQITAQDLDEQLQLEQQGWPTPMRTRMVDSVSQSFARTALAFVEEGAPFTQVANTQSFMMNIPMMAALAYMDATPRDDNFRPATDAWFLLKKYPNLAFKQVFDTDAMGKPVTLPEGAWNNPLSPHFLTFVTKRPAPNAVNNNCTERSQNGTAGITRVFAAMFGSRLDCVAGAARVFTEDDWNTFRMVTISPPQSDEDRSVFWDLEGFRKTPQLRLNTPRVGFFTSIAFFANWPTNDSNAFRVTTNQALIAGLGISFDDRDATLPLNDSDTQDQHIQPATTCFGCHSLLDPVRDFFRQSYSLTYFQLVPDPKKPDAVPPAHAKFTLVDNAEPSGGGVLALGNAIAKHPDFGAAWVQKLCSFANAHTCNFRGDPEFDRITKVFEDSNYNFLTLVTELMTSPLVTFSGYTKSIADEGQIISIARQDSFCERMSNRLGITDACNQVGKSSLPRVAAAAKNVASGLPSTGYSRGDVSPLMPHDPSVFYIAATERFCTLLAGQLIGNTARWTSANKETAMDDWVSTLLGMTSADERTPKLRQLLANHFDEALATGAKADDAMRSTFLLACASAPATSSGL